MTQNANEKDKKIENNATQKEEIKIEVIKTEEINNNNNILAIEESKDIKKK